MQFVGKMECISSIFILLSQDFCDYVTCSLTDTVIVRMQKLLCRIQSIGNVGPVRTVNAYRDVAVQLCFFLFLSLDGGEWSDLHHYHFTVEFLKCITAFFYSDTN